jgi:hypothetical protein
MSFSFNTTGGGVHISEAEFSVIGKQTINFVRVGNTTAQFINGVAHLYNLDIWTWGRGGINASFSYPSVGITGIASGATSQIFLTYTKYDNGVETREDHPNVPGNVMKLVGSKPLISVLQPDESLHIGQVRIIDIIVQADPQGNIAINSIPIQVNPDMFGSVFLGSGTNIVVKNSDNVTIPTSSTSFDLNHISKITFSGRRWRCRGCVRFRHNAGREYSIRTRRAAVIDGEVTWNVNGYRFNNPGDFVHLRVNPAPGRLLGRSPIEQHAEQIGTSLASGRFGNQWFSDGAHPSGILVNSETTLDQVQSDTAKERFMRLFRGSREPVVFGKGWDYKPIQINPEDSQFLDTQRFSEAQCARIFGPAMPETLGYETGGSMTYANVVDRRSDLLTLSLNRWLRRADRVLTSLLPKPQYARLNRDAFLESTTLARFEAHSRALTDRWRTVNEIRAIEDLPPVPWGDEPNAAKTTTTIDVLLDPHGAHLAPWLRE